MSKTITKAVSSLVCLAMLTIAPVLAYAEETGQNGSNENQASGSAQVTVVGSQVNATSVGALVQGGTENTAVGASILVVNNADQNGVDVGTVVGSLISGGSGNTAIGANSQVINGSDNRAVGYSSFAGNGDNNTAIGNRSYAGGGYNLQGQYFASGENIAVGYQAQAYGGSSVAVGAFSVANEPNTVSVGQPGYERRITNVAPGVYSTDAVNMGQLWETNNRINRVGATAMAMAGLAPMGYNPMHPTQFSAAVGTYGGKAGYAFGVYHYTHESVMLSAAFAMSSDRWEKAGRASITWWAGSSKKNKIVDNTVFATNLQTKPVQETSKESATDDLSSIDKQTD